MSSSSPAASRFFVGFGGLRLVVLCPDTEMVRLVRRAYDGFCRNQPFDTDKTVWEIRIAVRGELPEGLERALDVDKRPVDARRDGTGLELRSSWFEASADISTRVCELFCPAAVHPFDSLVRALMSIQSCSNGGFAAHAALVRLGDGCILVAGPSGAGKSTVAAAAGEAAMCDESAIVVRRAGEFLGAGTPFWSGRDVQLPLKAVAFLKQGTCTSARAVDSADALRLLWREVFVHALTEEETGRCWASASELVEKTRTLELETALGPSLWDDIRSAVG